MNPGDVSESSRTRVAAQAIFARPLRQRTERPRAGRGREWTAPSFESRHSETRRLGLAAVATKHFRPVSEKGVGRHH